LAQDKTILWRQFAILPIVAFDIDPAAVEKNYRQVRLNNEKHLLPLVLDLANPSPDLGWANRERLSLAARGPADALLALALVHHLAISNNLPLERIAEYFSQVCRWPAGRTSSPITRRKASRRLSRSILRSSNGRRSEAASGFCIGWRLFKLSWDPYQSPPKCELI
jgi:hypothetical protein